MNIIAATALIAGVLGFSSGAFLQNQLNQRTITNLRLAIEQGNLEAQAALQKAQQQVAESEKVAMKANRELEVSYEQSLKSINSLHDELTNRLRSKSTASRKNTVPSCESAEVSGTGTSPSDISARIIDMAHRADELAVYAQACWQFVKSNCGISTEVTNASQ